MSDYELKRSISDIQSKIASLDHSVMTAARRDRPRPGGLVARYAAVELLARAQKRSRADVAREFGTDRDLARLIELKGAMAPAQTTVAGWAAELVATVVQDIADNLLPQTACRNCAARAWPMASSTAASPACRFISRRRAADLF